MLLNSWSCFFCYNLVQRIVYAGFNSANVFRDDVLNVGTLDFERDFRAISET